MDSMREGIKGGWIKKIHFHKEREKRGCWRVGVVSLMRVLQEREREEGLIEQLVAQVASAFFSSFHNKPGRPEANAERINSI